LVGWLVGMLVGWLVCCLVGWFVGWLVGWSVCSVGWFVDWLFGWSGRSVGLSLRVVAVTCNDLNTWSSEFIHKCLMAHVTKLIKSLR